MSSLLDDVILVEGVAEVLFIGYVIVQGSPALLSSPIDACLREVIIIVAVRGMH